MPGSTCIQKISVFLLTHNKIVASKSTLTKSTLTIQMKMEGGNICLTIRHVCQCKRHTFGQSPVCVGCVKDSIAAVKNTFWLLFAIESFQGNDFG